MQKKFDHRAIEKKWQEVWEERGMYSTGERDDAREKEYVLVELPYPSGNLHIGHWYAFAIPDIYVRAHRMQGKLVIFPIGFDAFGLPAENAAIKRGLDPREWTEGNIAYMREQLASMGNAFSWDKTASTIDPSYYRWTQWMFTKFFENDIAYRGESIVNWDPVDNTVIANEQVLSDGTSERSGAVVEKRVMPQWMLKITDYADRLIDDLDALDWPESIKEAQRNWIGRSRGAEIDFTLSVVANPNPEEARSFIMGQKSISEKDIEEIGGKVERVTESGFLCVSFPKANIEQFEALIIEKMEQGFWNEYLTNEEVVFIFKHKNGGVERFVLNAQTDSQIVKLGNEFNGDEQTSESAWRWLANNSWYAPIIQTVTVFTTRPDTLFGATYLVLAPEYELVEKLKDSIENWDEVDAYRAEAAKKDEETRTANEKEKTGVELRGVTATNPANGEEIPVFVADYVLSGYGTGAIMAVPAHDERDFAFAKKYDLPIRPVVKEVRGEFREGAEPRTAVGAIVFDPATEKYLVQYSKEFGKYVFIFGGLEEGEGFEDAATRETLKETGYHTRFKRFIGDESLAYFYHPGKKVYRALTGRRALLELTDEMQDHVSKEELAKAEPIWLTQEELFEKVDDPDEAAAVRQLFSPSAFTGSGILYNSGEFDGMDSEEAKEAIVKKVGGQMTATYRLRDWSIGRQRYWGVPIPIVYDPGGKAHAVPEEHLPWLLPSDVDVTPTGEPPLAKSKELFERTERIFGKGWTPEVETMDTFVDSSWYFLRYIDNTNDDAFVSLDAQKRWMPVDLYFGGAEHTTMHLLYSRFWQKALFDLGLVTASEPYTRRRNRGLILGPDGNKMSKSKGNVIDPGAEVDAHGADAVKMYLAFMGPYGEVVNYPWDMSGILGLRRFLERVNGLSGHVSEDEPAEVTALLHKTIKKVGEDIENFKFNTAISAMMVFVNAAEKQGLSDSSYRTFLRLLAPFAPHLTEELWQTLRETESIHLAAFPEFDAALAKDETVTIGVQVNGKVRGEITIAPDASEEVAVDAARSAASLEKYLEGKEVSKVIYVPGRILNFIVGE
jgi:leucyl-tRNA synthetase